MERLEEYIAFDLEFNQHEGQTHLIQVSAVRFRNGQEIDAYDSYVHTSVPLKSFINGLTGITAETLKDAPPVETVIAEFQEFVGSLPMVGYNAAKSDLPILAEHGLDYSRQYKVDLYDEAFERRSSDLHGIAKTLVVAPCTLVRLVQFSKVFVTHFSQATTILVYHSYFRLSTLF